MPTQSLRHPAGLRPKTQDPFRCGRTPNAIKGELSKSLSRPNIFVMARIADSDDHILRRLRLRDLRVFFLVVELGSLAKAAALLRVSQPAVSRVIADLEQTLGVKLFDRHTRGVEPTLYGQALLSRSRAAFDELRQGVRDIEFLADPETGEVKIGTSQFLMAGFVASVIERLARQRPRIRFSSVEGNARMMQLALRDRRVDVIVGVSLPSVPAGDLVSQRLFDDGLRVVAGPSSPWLRRRKIDLAELVREPWVLPPPDTLTGMSVAQALSANALPLPTLGIISSSAALRSRLLATGRFISVLPASVLHFAAKHWQVRPLPVNLPGTIQPVDVVTLQRRTLSPAIQRFIETAREVATSLKAGTHGERI